MFSHLTVFSLGSRSVELVLFGEGAGAPRRREAAGGDAYTVYRRYIVYRILQRRTARAPPSVPRPSKVWCVPSSSGLSLAVFRGVNDRKLRARALPTRRKYRETSPCVVSRAWSRESCVLLLVIHTAPARSGAGFSSGSAFSLASRPALKCLDRRLSLIASQMIHHMQ